MLYPTSYSQARAITPHDSTNFDVNLKAGICDAVYVGAAGVVVAVFPDGQTVNFTAAVGNILPIRLKRVNSTSTTASLLVALYSV